MLGQVTQDKEIFGHVMPGNGWLFPVRSG